MVPVTLDGSGSSSTGSSLNSLQMATTRWPGNQRDDPASSRITFAMPPSTASGLVRFELEVDDEDGLVDVGQATVTGGVTVAAAIPVVDPASLRSALGLAALPYVRRRSR